MTTAFDRATEAAFTAASRQAGVSVTYSAGTGDSVTVDRAIPGETMFEELSDGDVIQSWQSRDWIIRVSDLSSLTASEPTRGHRITDGTRVYEVMSPAGGKPWRFSDRGRQWYRIHTKLVSET